MPTRKVPLRESTGVRLIQVEEVGPTGRVSATHYRLSTLRPNQPRFIADENEAHEAFDLEVIAFLADPTVERLVASGR